MNKLQALTLTSFFTVSAACNAQSSTTIYGIFDISAGVSRTTTQAGVRSHVTQMNPAVGQSSLLGFRGTEDLGNGLSALYNFEASTFPDTGAVGTAAGASGTNPSMPTYFNRHSWVGLRSNEVGTIKLGRTLTPTIAAYIPGNALPSGTNTGLTTTLTAQGLNNDFYQSNQIRYESPSFHGMSAQAHYAFGEVPTGGKGGDLMGLVVRYDSKSLALAAAYQRNKDAVGHAVTWRMLSGAYSFDRLKLTAGFNSVDVPTGLQSGATAAYRDSRMATIGAQYRATDLLTFGLQHWRLTDRKSSTRSHVTNFNARYTMSKRTSLYLMFGHSESGALPLAAINGFSPTAYARQTAYTAGISHSF